MNTLDLQYQTLLEDILSNGVKKEDRTGTGTISVFGRQIRHKMSEGFPLLTTKKMAWKMMVTELLWFLRGDTNIKFLVDNGCHIWDGDAYKNYDKFCIGLKWMEPVKKELNGEIYDMGRKYDKEGFVNRIKTDDEFAKKWGELGPIYGKQWRSWGAGFGNKNTDQIANLINDLKTNPDSRRLMVSAWNVGELDQMVLPPCHYGFQVYTRELSLEERVNIFNSKMISQGIRTQIATVDVDESYWRKSLEETKHDIPTRAISLMWNQRSVDTFLGLPFNIASYGLLLEIIAKEVNMVPDELIGNLGDVHLYSNHIEQAKEQIGRDLTCDERIELASADIHFDPFDFGVGVEASDESIHAVCDLYGVARKSRQPFELPTLKIEDEVKWKEGDCLPSYSITDFTLENYRAYPSIKAPLSN